jgi:SNF2 family DNA or RNA helicase
MKQLAGRSMVPSGPIRAEYLEDVHEAERRLDTQATQRVNTTQAAQELGLIGGNRPRMEGMPRHVWFRRWQPVAIYAMLSFQQTLRGGLLRDAMGLGKTIQMVGHTLGVSSNFQLR